VGIGIENTNAGISIPAFFISVRYRTKKCRTEQLYSGTGLFPASLVFSVRYRINRMPHNPVFRHCCAAELHHFDAALGTLYAAPAPTLLNLVPLFFMSSYAEMSCWTQKS
jgi:hypothetical protein